MAVSRLFNGPEGHGTLGVFGVYSKGILRCSGSVQEVFPVMPGAVLGLFPGGSVDVSGMFWGVSGMFWDVLGVFWGCSGGAQGCSWNSCHLVIILY